MTFWTGLIAQASQPGPAPSMNAADFLRSPMVPIIVLCGFMFWWMSRNQKKERDKYQQMLNSLKRNDRVQTIGGVYGTVVEVKDNEIVLKIDEASNVKMRVNRASIKEIYRDAGTITAPETAKS